jgi:hypothetical protein
MSVVPSAFCTGLSIVFNDGNGWPLSRPEPVTGAMLPGVKNWLRAERRSA